MYKFRLSCPHRIADALAPCFKAGGIRRPYIRQLTVPQKCDCIVVLEGLPRLVLDRTLDVEAD